MKIEELRTIDGKVNYILLKHHDARDSDRVLLKEYVRLFVPEIYAIPFYDAVIDERYPNTESLRRARQKLQQTFPELRGSKWAEDIRAENEEVYKDYVNS